jgi:hypothetical protein
MFSFKRNMGTADRAIRATLGIAFLVLGPLTDTVVSDGLSSTLLGVIGALALFSALISYCFLYEITGFCTLNSEQKQ